MQPEKHEIIQYFKAQLGPRPAVSRANLSSSVAELAELLNDEIRLGAVYEWGMPEGHGGREIIVDLLRSAMTRQWHTLWVATLGETMIYPPCLGGSWDRP